MNYKCCRCGNKTSNQYDLCDKCKKYLKEHEKEESCKPSEVKGKTARGIQ